MNRQCAKQHSRIHSRRVQKHQRLADACSWILLNTDGTEASTNVVLRCSDGYGEGRGPCIALSITRPLRLNSVEVADAIVTSICPR
jgi:hypothetical protein